MPRPAMSLAVAGADFPNRRGSIARRFEIAMCSPGEAVELRPEPNNRADPRAIAVFSIRGIQIGYLTAERAPLIGGMLANGHDAHAIFQAPTRAGAIIRAGFDGEAPALPPAIDLEEPAPADDGFYPDEEWPDT
jgi:hypothetical protein